MIHKKKKQTNIYLRVVFMKLTSCIRGSNSISHMNRHRVVQTESTDGFDYAN